MCYLMYLLMKVLLLDKIQTLEPQSASIMRKLLRLVLGQNSNVGVQNSGTTDEIDNDDEKLENFLKSINMECIFNVLKSKL